MVQWAENWRWGWGLILAGFLTGAGMGVRFHEEEFLGGYASFRRRVLRLGHIACVALGTLNVVFAGAAGGSNEGLRVASAGLIAGGVLMPAVCFLTAWREEGRRLFVVPVVCLVVAAVGAIVGGGL
jgi:hypothetical protein